MFSNFVRASMQLCAVQMPCCAVARCRPPGRQRLTLPTRTYSDLVPPNQYDVPIPKRLHLGYVLKEYWETIPLFVTTCTALLILFSSIIFAVRNKVDVVYSARSRGNISRTMDLRNPSKHKVIIINQRYEPWPEMQDLLDKMTMAEKRARVRAESCNHP